MNESIKINKWEDLINVNYFINTNGLRVTFDTKKENLELLLDVGNGYIRFKTYSTHSIDLKIAVDDLRKLGFNIEYEEPFNLIEFLKENLYKKTFKAGETNYYFVFYTEHNLITMDWKIKKQILGVSYLGTKGIDTEYIIEKKLKKEKVTKVQLIGALKELGWI